jgi:hypothetical protein
MKPSSRAAWWLVAFLVLAGCASAEVTSRQPYEGEKLARPDRIIVHDFAATPADIPADSPLAAQAAAPGTPQTPAEIETGRKLGAQVAKELVANIQEMGLPAVQAAGQPPPRVGDLVIRGYFLSVDEGSARERMLLGFGSGAAQLKTAVEGYLMTDQGLRRLGSGEVDSGGGKAPGVVAPLVVTAATHNPIGLVVGGAVQLHEHATGADTIEGAGRRTADEIAAQIKPQFQKQGWI